MAIFITLLVTLFLVFLSFTVVYFDMSKRVIRRHRPGQEAITFENSVQILDELKREVQNVYIKHEISRAIVLRRMSYIALMIIGGLLFINGLWGIFY